LVGSIVTLIFAWRVANCRTSGAMHRSPMAVEQVVRRCQGRGGYSRQEQSPDPYPARSCEIPLAQSRRALVQQAQELAPRRHTI
jgi:hypothetical protein